MIILDKKIFFALVIVCIWLPSCEKKMTTEKANELLISSVKKRDISGVQEAFRLGAAINAGHDVVMPMDLAASNGDIETMKVLISHGSTVVDKNITGSQPIHFASSGYDDSPDMILFLITNGANPNSVDASGDTPVFYATKLGHLKSVKVLLDNGADISHYNPLEGNLIFISERYGYKELSLYLKSRGLGLRAPQFNTGELKHAPDVVPAGNSKNELFPALRRPSELQPPLESPNPPPKNDTK